MEPDFSGYATKAGLKCSDGRTITAEAFKHMDGKQVPLVWQHGHKDPANVLGHAVLEARPDGIYAQGFFNETKSGVNTKALVQHKDINQMSIWANNLVEKSQTVLHGIIREVSLVLSGANPGAKIDYVRVAHGDGDVEVLDDEAIIFTGLEIQHGSVGIHPDEDEEEEVVDGTVEHASADSTVQEIYNSMDETQKGVLNYMIGVALKAAQNNPAEHSDTNDEGDVAHKEGSDDMTRNVFDQDKKNGTDAGTGDKHVLSHDAMKGIVADAVRGGSLKDAVEAYALAHGITNLEVLLPDARTLTDRPEFQSRRMEWVAGVLGGTHHSPFSRVKTVTADITQDEARAKGYIKGTYKKEEWFSVTKRTTTPTTVYKKQKLDRDDIIDITDFDVVAWMKAEMRVMLEEEIARAILVGDGRAVDDEDKIKDPLAATDGIGIRSIANEHELFATTVYVNIDDASSSYMEVVESLVRARKFYKGTGSPTFYTTEPVLTEMLLLRDETGSNRRLYNTEADLAAALRVREIVTVEAMENSAYGDLVGVIVNLADYNIGADKGGEVNLFDDFDIDYNQYKYLIETRISGALTKIKSALIIRKTVSTNVLVAPTVPGFVAATGVITIPTKTGVVYKNGAGTTLTAGAQTALTAGASLVVNATPASGYYFATNAEDSWTFKRPAA